jgi:ankyrin repeat protein
MEPRSVGKRNALHDAVESGTFNDVTRAFSPKLLNQQTSNGSTPLHLAVAKNRWWAVIQLIHRKANPNIQDMWGDTPLHIASKKSDLTNLLTLLNAKADVTLKNKRGETAFHIAVIMGHVGVVEEFFSKKMVDVNEPNTEGWTPLHMAARGGRVEIMKLLIGSD